MKKIPINLWWSFGAGDSGSFKTDIEISEDLFNELLNIYNSEKGISFDDDIEFYNIDKPVLYEELLNVRQKVLDEFRSVEEENWNDFLKERYPDFDDFDDYFENCFMCDYFKAIRVDPWTDLNTIS